MITEKRTDTLVEGNLEAGETRVMGIRAEALVNITDSLANLYSDRYLAVLREYSTNARDSHVAAGKADVPIQITLPDEFSQDLVIRDFGLGLTKEQVLDFYAQYGASDKRQSNDYVGTLGYGCKSAFCIDAQFVVTAVQSGLKTVAVFYRDETGLGIARIVSHTATDEPNGVEVKIPISDYAQMAETAERFFSSWEPGTVLVDGVAPKSWRDSALSLDNVHFVKHQPTKPGHTTVAADGVYHKGVNIVMGNITYPVNSDWRYRTQANWFFALVSHGALYIDAPIGAVDIVPSREGLKDTKRTLEYLGTVAQAYGAALVAHVTGLVSNAASLFQAAQLLHEWRPLLPSRQTQWKAFSWNGHQVNTIVGIPVVTGTHEMYEYRRVSKRAYSNRLIPVFQTQVQVGAIPKTLALINVPDHHTKLVGLSGYCDEHGYQLVIPLVGRRRFAYEWFTSELPEVTVVDYATWAAERKAEILAKQRATRAQNGGGPREQVSYDVLIGVGGVVKTLTVKEIKDLGVPLYYAGPAGDINALGLRYLLGDVTRPAAILLLNSLQRAETLERRFGTVLPYKELAEVAVSSRVAGFTRQQRSWLAAARARNLLDSDVTYVLRSLASADVADPQLRKLVRLVSTTDKQADQFIQETESWFATSLRILDGYRTEPYTHTVAYRELQSQLHDEAVERYNPSLVDRYPLLAQLNGHAFYAWRAEGTGRAKALQELRKHVAAYVNAAYENGLTVTADNDEQVA